jgi:hypothetical protein
MGRARWVISATSDLDRSREGQKLEPGQRVAGGSDVLDPPCSQLAKGAERGCRMARVHRARAGPTEMEFRRRVMPMAARARAALCRNDAMFFEVPHHPRREAHRLPSRTDPRKVSSIIFIERSACHDSQSTIHLSDIRQAKPSDQSIGNAPLDDLDRPQPLAEHLIRPHPRVVGWPRDPIGRRAGPMRDRGSRHSTNMQRPPSR